MSKEKLNLRVFFKAWLPFFFAMALLAPPALSQSGISRLFLSKEKLADRLYEEKNFSQALKLYNQARPKQSAETRILVKKANCYYKLNDPAKAVDLYRKAEGLDHSFDDASRYNFYMALNNAGLYAGAQKLIPEDGSGFPSAADLYGDSANYRLQKVEINSEYTDFGAAFYDFGIVFLSSRPKTDLIKKIDASTGEDFYDLYYSRLGEDGRLLEPELFSGQIETKTPFHFGGCAFYDSENKMIFAMNTPAKGRAESPTRLFMAERNDQGVWQVVRELFPDKKGSFGQPFVDEKNNRLFFVSDALEGYGGADIYYCSLADESEIHNAGSTINTPGNDLFPAVYDGLFLYSTNAKPGLGGLDIFAAPYEEGKLGKAKNLGYPINSSKDDFGMRIDKYGEFGFLSSNRENKKGKDNIYKVNFLQPLNNAKAAP